MKPLVLGAALLAAVVSLTLSPAFADVQVLHHFSTRAALPPGDLVRDDGGNLYGVTRSDGINGLGTVFELSFDGHYTTLHEFSGGSDGAQPEAGLIRDADGNLYGTTYSGGPSDQGTVFKIAPDGSESVLYAFKGGSDGANPRARLMRDTRGNLYGTTQYGGNTDGRGYWGTVFRITPAGRKKIIYAFQDGTDASGPMAGVIRDARGNLYGTTAFGGAYGCGAVYKIAPDGHESVLASLPNVRGIPMGALVADDAGNLYGTTVNGTGSVFEVTPEGALSTLVTFRRKGHSPYSTLLIDRGGNLYGTTYFGGHTVKGDGEGCGSVFKVTPPGKLQTLHLFTGGKDGCRPFGGLAIDGRGDFFGTTVSGSRRRMKGTIFEVSE